MRTTSKWPFYFGLISLLLFPLLGSLIRWQGLPPGFGILAQQARQPADFNWTVFILLGSIFAGIVLFLVKPSLFGFSHKGKANPYFIPPSEHKNRLPIWFWAGLLVCLLSWTIMWGQFEFLGMLRHFMFVPLWWGFIFTLDGLLYKRTGGKSFFSLHPKLLLICAVMSEIGWYYFEFLNFLVLKNWYYPYIELIPKPYTYLWSALTFSTVWPALFIWYQLLSTFKPFTQFYADGPRISPSKKGTYIYLVTGLALCVITSIEFELLFWLIWLGPLMVLTSACSLAGIWTPFTPIREGNWSPVITMGLAALFNGFFWEMWNYWSQPNNPNFWHYNLPYIHDFLIFEMPFLGYSGYLFFGSMCWVMFIAFCHLVGLNGKYDLMFAMNKSK